MSNSTLYCPLCYYYGPPSTPQSQSLSPQSSPQSHSLCPLPLSQLDCEVYIAYNVSLVTLRLSCLNLSPQIINGIFLFPTQHGQAIMTSCDIYYNGRHFVSSVVDPLVLNIERDRSIHDKEEMPYDPEAFSMPFFDCPPNTSITIDISYIQHLTFNQNGSFQLIVPMRIPPSHLPPQYGQFYSTIKCVIDSGTPTCQWQSTSHPMYVTEQNSLLTAAVALQSPPIPFSQSNLFVLEYYGFGDRNPMGSCLVEPPSGNFILHLSPAALPSNAPGSWPEPGLVCGRNIVFLLDHSGSMGGGTIVQARLALQTALNMLTPSDYFSICAFDHEMLWFHTAQTSSSHPPLLYQAHSTTIAIACQWIQSIQANGMTDILHPYQLAMDLLSRPKSDQNISPSPGVFGSNKVLPETQTLNTNLPIIFLVTDGAVENELEIYNFMFERVKNANSSTLSVRTFAFGIGPFVNPYFLKSLAEKGRGYSEICLHQEVLASNITELMRRTYAPQLVNIRIELPSHLQHVEIFPFPIPDLYAGYPVTVAGKYSGNFPNLITVRGCTPMGQEVAFQVSVRLPYRPISLDKLFASFYLDHLVSSYWREKDVKKHDAEKYQKEASRVSCQTGVPCVFTKSIAYETHPNVPPKEIQQQAKVNGPTDGITTKDAILTGSIIALGATITGIVMFGNITATANNIDLDQAFKLIQSLQVNSATMSSITTGISHLVGNIAHNSTPAFHQLGHLGQNVGGQIVNTGGKVVGQISSTAAPVVQTMGHAAGEIGEAASPVLSQVVEGGGNACCFACHQVCHFGQTVCNHDNLRIVGKIFCCILKIIS